MLVHQEAFFYRYFRGLAQRHLDIPFRISRDIPGIEQPGKPVAISQGNSTAFDNSYTFLIVNLALIILFFPVDKRWRDSSCSTTPMVGRMEADKLHQVK